MSETERAVVRSPGAIKRLTVAVLVNDLADVDQAGQVTTSPRPEEELVALRELVSSAVGFDEERGDVITIKSMALQSIPASGTEASTSFMDQIEIDVMSAIQMAVLAIVTVILGLFVVRPLLSRPSPQLASTPQLPDLEAGGMIENGPGGDQDSGFEGLPDLSFGGEAGDLPDLPGLPDFSGGGLSDDPVDRLRSMIGERQEETVEVLRSWLEEERESNAT